MENPIGYLYRVGRTSGTPWLHRPTRLPDPHRSEPPWIEPALPAGLSRLSRNQQTAVLLIKAYGLTYREVAELLAIGVSTVQKHGDRGLRTFEENWRLALLDLDRELWCSPATSMGCSNRDEPGGRAGSRTGSYRTVDAG
jgi:hypothetical protein